LLRKELLEAEKERMRRGDELARRRQELPWVPVENADGRSVWRMTKGGASIQRAELARSASIACYRPSLWRSRVAAARRRSRAAQ